MVALMKENTNKLPEFKTLLIINNHAILWQPCLFGEKRHGYPFLGVAIHPDGTEEVIWSRLQIESSRPITETEAMLYRSAYDTFHPPVAVEPQSNRRWFKEDA